MRGYFSIRDYHKTPCIQLAQIISLTILGTSVRSLQLHFTKLSWKYSLSLMVAGDSRADVYLAIVVKICRIMVNTRINRDTRSVKRIETRIGTR